MPRSGILSKKIHQIFQKQQLKFQIVQAVGMREEDETIVKLKHQEFEESREEEHEVKKKAARDHSSNILHSAIVRDDDYRKCIPLRERIGSWFYNSAHCTSSETSFVEKLEQLEHKHPLKKQLQDKIIKLKIIQTSRLQLDSNVIHPFVRIHVVDKRTGCYIKKNHEQSQSIVYHNEAITFYENRTYDTCENDVILPFATNPCDFRKIGNSVCKWNQKFFINFPADRIVNADTLILFQILDFNHQALLFKDTSTYDRDNLYRIAWGYLRPVGMSKNHLGISKIQLYQYKFNNKKHYNDDKVYIPSVYYDFLWNNHEKYEGFLSVQLMYVTAPHYRHIDDDAECTQNLFEQENLDPTFLDRIEGANVEKEEQAHVSNTKLFRFYKNNDKSEVPKELIYKFESEKLGCFRTLFVGNYLYAACSTKKHTNVKVFSLDKGEKVMTLKGHREMIYSMCVTPNQRYLITAGSDFFVRIWEIPSVFGQYIDEEESESLIRAEIIHTAAVYSAACIHVPLNDKFYILSCCYDGIIRLWQANLQTKQCQNIKQVLVYDPEKLPYKVFPTTCVVSQSNYFIVGDSVGEIRIFDFAHNTLNLRCKLRSDELRQDSIICIKIINKNNIFVQASDNLIRHFELTTNKLRQVQKYTGAQFETQLCNFSVSSDNRYVLSPSETGKPVLWDIITGGTLSLDHLNLDIKGPLISCDWHRKYNLVAFGGFVELCPVLVYGNILSQAEQKIVAAHAL